MTTPTQTTPRTPPRLADESFEKFWKPEPWDDIIPPDGFIHDFVLALRGIETPTKLAFWTAIFALSTALKRESFIVRYPKKMYPNFFIIVVGPPRLVAKSTAVDYVDGEILTEFNACYKDDIYFRTLKQVKILRSRVTPEALSEALTPRAYPVIVDGRHLVADQGSQLALIISELATFFGKQKYNTGLIDKMIHLYDCKDKDDDVTVARGHKDFRNVYVTMFGATTRDGLENSIPEEAFGSGFMSRTMLVYQDTPTRSYSEPLAIRRLDGKPMNWEEELRKRLAWVAQKGQGEYLLDEGAAKAYDHWYHKFKKKLIKEKDPKVMLLQSRFDVHLLKLMLILRAQRYEFGNIMTVEDFELAKRILDYTYEDNRDAVEDVEATPMTKAYNRLTKLLKKYKQFRRTDLLRRVSQAKIYSQDVNLVIRQLVQEGKVAIKSAGGSFVSIPSSSGEELYIWKERRFNLGQTEEMDTEGSLDTIVSLPEISGEDLEEAESFT